MTSSTFINYPTGRVLAVANDAAVADQATTALQTAGWLATDVTRLRGPDAARAFDATGTRHGLVTRLRRILQFTLMDQLPDLAWYQAAIEDGRIVLSVRATDARSGARVASIVAAAGCHFVNRYGRFQTEELVRWRGPEPSVDDVMRR